METVSAMNNTSDARRALDDIDQNIARLAERIAREKKMRDEADEQRDAIVRRIMKEEKLLDGLVFEYDRGDEWFQCSKYGAPPEFAEVFDQRFSAIRALFTSEYDYYALDDECMIHLYVLRQSYLALKCGPSIRHVDIAEHNTLVGAFAVVKRDYGLVIDMSDMEIDIADHLRDAARLRATIDALSSPRGSER